MIKIKSVKMRNFLITGNREQEILLDNNGLSLILGNNLDIGGDNSRNGVGKSTIFQAVSYGLYGQPITNIKLDNMVNSINEKNMVVEVVFEVNDVKYKVVRGRKPVLLKFYIDDVDTEQGNESQGDSRRTQEDIDRVLGMTYQLFKHVVIMSTFVDPFLKQKPPEQRAIIEELLGITQLSDKGEVLKEQIKQSKLDIKEEEFRIKTIEDSNANIQSTIDNLIRSSENWTKKKEDTIALYLTQVDQLSEIDIAKEIENHELLNSYNILDNAIKVTEREIKNFERDVNRLVPTFDSYERQMEQAKESKCHACGQDVNAETHKQHVQILQESMLKVAKDLEVVSKDMTEKELYLAELKDAMGMFKAKPKTIYDSLQDAYNHKTIIDTVTNQLNAEKETTNPYLDQIATLETNAIKEVSYARLEELRDNLKHEEFLSKLLTSKDSFIRKKIIDSNISSLNQRVSYYLDKLRLPYAVEFKNDLSVDISMLGREYDFEQLSRGEMQRVVIALSWSFRDVWENINTPINLMLIDEVLDFGMDGQGLESSLEVLAHMANERKKDIFIISHKEECLGRVNKVLTVTKQNSFASFQQ